MLCVLECWHVKVKAGDGGASEAGDWVETKGRRTEEEREGSLSIITIVYLTWWYAAAEILSGRTRMSRYQHLPTHTYRGHQSSLICFIHLIRFMASSLINPVFFHNLSLSFLWSTSWPGTHNGHVMKNKSLFSHATIMFVCLYAVGWVTAKIERYVA